LDAAAIAAGKAWPKGMLCGAAGQRRAGPGCARSPPRPRPTCALVDGTFMGGGGEPPILRYEIACKDGKGYIVDTPAPGSTAAVVKRSLRRSQGGGRRLHPDRQEAWLKPGARRPDGG
jgi:hypothetical protein